MMTTSTTSKPGKAARRPAKARTPDTCSLIVRIRGVAYAARPLPCDTGRAWRLRNTATGDVYDVAEAEHGPTCDCADATYRHDGSDGNFCKHVRACAALNLITLTAESDPATWPQWCDRIAFRVGRS